MILRKALAALLVAQGLRPTHAGGHISVYDAIMAQFDPPLGDVFRPFGWMLTPAAPPRTRWSTR